ncbi:MAG: TolC family protein [Alphaproteobacteria bacterium]|nr:TolC family protein [Alphaproteobacteria bacterium]
MNFIKLSMATFVAAGCLISTAYAQNGEFCVLAKSALYKNYNLESLRQQLNASDERIIQSKNANGPRLSLLGNLLAYSEEQGSTNITNNATLALSYSQTLFDSGLSDARTGQANGNKRLLNLDLAASSRDTIVEVARAYVNFVKNIQLLSLGRKNLGNINEQLHNVEDKFAASEATQQELSLVKSRVRQAMSDMLRSKAEVLLSRVRLMALTNKKAIGDDSGFMKSLLNNIPGSSSAAIKMAQANSIEIDKTGIAIDIAQLEIEAQEASLGANVQATASFGFGKIGDDTGVASRVGLALNLPLYSSGVLESKVREAKAMLASARARRAYMTELSKQNVSVAYEITKSIQQSLAILPEAIREQEAAIASLEQSLARSFISTADVLLAKNSIFELQKSLVQLRFERYSSNLELLNSVGKLQSVASLNTVGLCK